jgi:hypothetical protein
MQQKKATFFIATGISFLALIAVLSLLYFYWVGFSGSFGSPNYTDDRIYPWGEVNAVTLTYNATKTYHLALELSNNQWTIKAPTTRSSERLRQKSVKHLLSILESTGQTQPTQNTLVSAKDLDGKGLIPPLLAAVLRWNKPKATVLELHFGQPTLGGKNVFLYQPQRKTIESVGGTALAYVTSQGQPFDVLIDQRFTAFETDDIELFETSGLCRNYHIERNGAEWTIHSGPLSIASVEAFLDHLTGVSYLRSASQENKGTPLSEPWCRMHIKGRAFPEEIISISAPKNGIMNLTISRGQQPEVNYAVSADELGFLVIR